MCDLPSEAYDDCFHPPSIPTQVFCLHCQEIYDSYLIEWREEKSPSGLQGFWRCPTPGCSGAGFGFDIHPVDPDYVDPDGRDMGEWCFDDDEEWDEDECAALDEIDACEELDSEDATRPPGPPSLPGPPGSGEHVPEWLEAAFTGPEDEPDSFAIPMDDLLPMNEAVDAGDLTLEVMEEIERKIGWRDGGKHGGKHET